MAENKHQPDCVVIDTNIWRSDLLLKNPIGTTLVYTLGRQGGVICLPEVIETELKTQVVQHGLEAVAEMDKNSKFSSSKFGR
jgi:predicted nucleic acid-binding protein